MTAVDGVVGAALDPGDRGLQYGDGVFRTLRVHAGRPLWWRAQLAKLAADCARLSLACPPEASWRADLAAVLAGARPDGVLKLLVTRGSGARGYRPPVPARARRIVQFFPGPLPAFDAGAGICARVCSLRLGHQPALAGIKHLCRLENVLARAEWNDPAIADALLLDQDERVIGGVMSNLLIWRAQCLSTPRIDRCGVAGITRALLLEGARAAGIGTAEVDLTLGEVLDADEVMLCNSLMGVRPIARIEERVWPQPVISPRLATLLDSFDVDDQNAA